MERSSRRKWSWWQFLMQLGGSELLLSCRPQETEITTWPPQGKLYPKHIHLSVCSSRLHCNFWLQTKALFRRHKGVSSLSTTQFRYRVLNESVNNIRMFLKSTSLGLLCWRLFIKHQQCYYLEPLAWLMLCLCGYSFEKDFPCMQSLSREIQMCSNPSGHAPMGISWQEDAI